MVPVLITKGGTKDETQKGEKGNKGREKKR